jgi:hypothetical protein
MTSDIYMCISYSIFYMYRGVVNNVYKARYKVYSTTL